MTKLYFEDLRVGDTFEVGERTVTRDEIVAFAHDFDPQPFHLDDEAAKGSIFGGLVASGWHTASLAMRMYVDGFVSRSASLGSPGVDELRWHRPVRPGDTLRLRTEIVETTPSRSKPDRGSVRIRYELTNQHGEVVMTMVAIGIVGRKPAGRAPGSLL